MVVSMSGKLGGSFRSPSTSSLTPSSSSSTSPATNPVTQQIIAPNNSPQVIASGGAKTVFEQGSGKVVTAQSIGASRENPSFLGRGGAIIGRQVGRNDELMTVALQPNQVPAGSYTVSQLMSPQNIKEEVYSTKAGVPKVQYSFAPTYIPGMSAPSPTDLVVGKYDERTPLRQDAPSSSMQAKTTTSTSTGGVTSIITSKTYPLKRRNKFTGKMEDVMITEESRQASYNIYRPSGKSTGFGMIVGGVSKKYPTSQASLEKNYQADLRPIKTESVIKEWRGDFQAMQPEKKTFVEKLYAPQEYFYGISTNIQKGIGTRGSKDAQSSIGGILKNYGKAQGAFASEALGTVVSPEMLATGGLIVGSELAVGAGLIGAGAMGVLGTAGLVGAGAYGAYSIIKNREGISESSMKAGEVRTAGGLFGSMAGGELFAIAGSAGKNLISDARVQKVLKMPVEFQEVGMAKEKGLTTSIGTGKGSLSLGNLNLVTTKGEVVKVQTVGESVSGFIPSQESEMVSAGYRGIPGDQYPYLPRSKPITTPKLESPAAFEARKAATVKTNLYGSVQVQSPTSTIGYGATAKNIAKLNWKNPVVRKQGVTTSNYLAEGELETVPLAESKQAIATGTTGKVFVGSSVKSGTTSSIKSVTIIGKQPTVEGSFGGRPSRTYPYIEQVQFSQGGEVIGTRQVLGEMLQAKPKLGLKNFGIGTTELVKTGGEGSEYSFVTQEKTVPVEVKLSRTASQGRFINEKVPSIDVSATPPKQENQYPLAGSYRPTRPLNVPKFGTGYRARTPLFGSESTHAKFQGQSKTTLEFKPSSEGMSGEQVSAIEVSTARVGKPQVTSKSTSGYTMDIAAESVRQARVENLKLESGYGSKPPIALIASPSKLATSTGSSYKTPVSTTLYQSGYTSSRVLSSTKVGTTPTTKFNSGIKTQPVVENKLITIPSLKVNLNRVQTQDRITSEKVITSQKIENINPFEGNKLTNPSEPTPTPPPGIIVPTPAIPAYGGGGFSFGKPFRSRGQPTKYRPTATAAVFGIYGSKKDSTGLGIRPIIGKEKKKGKKGFQW